MRDYELMIVLNPNLDEAGIEEATTRVSTVVGQRGGSVHSMDLWGRRRLAYPIPPFRDGVYVLYKLGLAGGQTVELERSLKLTENIIRHLVVRVEETAAPRVAAQR